MSVGGGGFSGQTRESGTSDRSPSSDVLDIGLSNGFASGNVKGPMTSSLITPHLVPRHVTFNGAHGQKENLSKASVPPRILGGLGPWGGRSSGLLGPLRQCHYMGCSYKWAPM